jgi:hypothetical protein
VNRDAESLKLVNILDLERIDIAQVSPPQLRGLLLRAMSLGAMRVCYRCARAVTECEQLASDAQLQIIALSNLLNLVPSLAEKLEISKQLETEMAHIKNPVGRIILQRLSILHALGRAEEAQQTLMEAFQQHPEDPYLLSFMQHAMQASGGGRGGSLDPGEQLAMRMMQNPSRATPSESGLVLPGQSSASSGEGESKLWLPGS